MSQPDYVNALDLPPTPIDELDDDMKRYAEVCQEKLGMIPNVLTGLSFNQDKLRNFINYSGELMQGESGLSKLEREMIAVVVSSVNRCFYCLTSHGSAVRKLSGDPILGEILMMNYRVAQLPPRQRAMLDFAVKLTERPHEMGEPDRQALRDAGFSDRDIWDIVSTAAFFNMSNRIAAGVDMMPNKEYHRLAR